MRMIVFFDLPVTEKPAQKAAAKFRNFLVKDGYLMIQFSVYSRVCNGYDAVKTHEKRLKQHESMQILLGEYVQSDIPVAYEQLTLL